MRESKERALNLQGRGPGNSKGWSEGPALGAAPGEQGLTWEKAGKKRQRVPMEPVSGNAGDVCFNHRRGEWLGTGSGVGLPGLESHLSLSPLCGLGKVIHPL